MSKQKGVVLLIGAGDGIGAAVARRFAEGGYKVCIVRRDAGKSEALVKEMTGKGLSLQTLSADARNEGDVQRLFADVENNIGPIEVCLFNAGSNVNKPLLETTGKLFFKAWELACYAGFLVGREAARYMTSRGSGTILFTGATASIRGGKGFAAFFDSKEAILFAILDAHVRRMISDVEAAMAGQSATLERFRAAIRAIVELNARSTNEQRVILNDLSSLGDADQKAIKTLERRLVEAVSNLLVQLDGEGKIAKRSKRVYTMMLFGMLNFSHTWYDPKGDIPPKEFADMVVDLFLHGFTAPPAEEELVARPRRQRA